MKINSSLAFSLLLLLLLVSYSLAVETSQHETMTQEAKGTVDKVEPAGNGGGNWGGGGGGNWGGGGGGNWGGGGGGGGSGWCRHGCCSYGYRGRCNYCCRSPEEAKAYAEKQVHP